jgi:hypothetical protein
VFRHGAVVGTAITLTLSLSAGCGESIADLFAARAIYVAECGEGDAARVDDLVVLDWRGGVTPLHPDESFDALDLSQFPTSEGTTLAEDAELFHERVREQVARIFCESNGPLVQVLHADDSQFYGTSRVFLTQALSPATAKQIGEGEYDPCNDDHDNIAVIFGEQIRLLSGVYTFDEWVLVFANVTAHEVAHTLGYGHVSRSTLTASLRSPFVELMLESHSMDELRREQRFVVDQTHCPSGETAADAVIDAAAVNTARR